MRTSRLPLLTLLAVAALARPAAAQTLEGVAADSLPVYGLGEVVVGAADGAPPPTTLRRVPAAALARRDASSVADVAALIPAAAVRQNSRGETLLFVRGAGERQTALYLDGALLNVPWDNRPDLALVPAAVVGEIEAATGVPSVRFGPNVIGGAVNLVSRARAADGWAAEGSVASGTLGLRRAEGTALARRGAWSGAVHAGHARRAADALAAGLPFSQPDPDARTNSDLARTALFGRAAWAPSPEAALGVTALHVSAEHGVPPEGHLDPARERVRYWRYPHRGFTSLVVSGQARTAGWGVRGAAWATAVRQTIEQYGGLSYASVSGSERGEDETLGARLVGERAGAAGALRLVLNGLASRHRQRESQAAAETFRVLQGSAGVEWERALGRRGQVLVGLGADAVSTPETGGREAQPAQAAWTATLGGRLGLGEPASLRAALGTRTRFPTLRERYGEALGRFVPNPALRPERAWTAEVGGGLSGGRLAADLVAFGTWTEGLIEQEALPDGRRRRVNLGSSRALGLEASAAAGLPGHVRLDGHVTAMDLRGAAADGSPRRVFESPTVLGWLSASWAPPDGLGAAIESRYTGVAYSPADGGAVRLPHSLAVNARLRWRQPFQRGAAEAFLRVDNVSDAEVLPQAGLPAPGRTVQVGLTVTV